MSLDLTHVFTSLGRCAREGYLIAGGQSPQGVPFSELAALSYVNPSWIAPLAQSYDAGIRAQSAGMSAWVSAAQTILQKLVAADDPAYGISLPSALSYLYQQMIAQSATVARCTVGSTVTADAANVGKGVVFVTLVRSDGVPLEHTVAETSTLLVTADSYTDGAVAGREPWSWAGAPNVSTLGTGVTVSTWDYDWPAGSAGSASGNFVSASQDANTAGNFLTNGDFETWTAGTGQPPDNWVMDSGVWGTAIVRGTTALDGSYSLQFKGGTGTCGIRTQFNSTVSDSTNAAAGTSAALTALASPPYAFNLWLRSAAGTVGAGVMTVDLVDGSGTVIADQAGTNNTNTIALTGLTTTWQAKSFAFRTPRSLPATARLRIRITTGITGDDVFVDSVAFCRTVNAYPGGLNLCGFSDPAAPFVAGPDPDAFTITTTNNRAGASYGATWQTAQLRIFQTPTLLLPSTTSPPTVADTLITGV